MAGKIIADIIEAPYDSIRMNVANVTVLTANSSGLTYVPTGNVNINIGNTANITVGTLTANGIKFPATQVTSADGNTLDDYEEGTWTPSILWGGSDTGAVYTFQVGTYTKVGSVVYFQGYSQITTQSSATGTFTVGGLPFVARNTSSLITLSNVGLDNASSNITQPRGRVEPNTTAVLIMGPADTNNWGVLTNTIRSASFRVFVSGHYYV
jgi:hypothetical protein